MEVEYEVSPDSLNDEFIRFKQDSCSSLSTDTTQSVVAEDVVDSVADRNGLDCTQLDETEDPCSVYEDLQFLTKVIVVLSRPCDFMF